VKGITRRGALVGALAGATLLPRRAVASGTVAWRNWSGGQIAQPRGRLAPATEEALVDLVTGTTGPLRPVGAGHSFTPLVPTDGHLVVLDRLAGLVEHDESSATFGAGTRLAETGPVLEAIGQAFINLPDIDRQTLAGAISTATHGTGFTLNTLSAYVQGLRLVTVDGKVMDLDADHDGDVFRAAQVSIGALGFVTRVRMRTRPLYRLKERSWVQPTEEVLETFDDEVHRYRHFEMFPLTHSKYAIVQAIEETDEPIHNPPIPADQPDAFDDLMRSLQSVPVVARQPIIDTAVAAIEPEPPVVDSSYKVLANIRNYRFNEMEYSVPLEAGAACLREILKKIDDDAIDVVFPLEYRYIAGDDLMLSMFSGGPRASISIHRDARFDYKPYFDAIEPIFWKHGGRPHWGKVHSLGYRQLKSLYPALDDFRAIRAALDPDGRLINAHLAQLLDVTT